MDANTPYGIVLQGFVPVRKEPFERSEMITQVLFGETIEILDDEAKWLYARLKSDGYEGWVDAKCVTKLSGLPDPFPMAVASNCSVHVSEPDTWIQVPAGASIPALKHQSFEYGRKTYKVDTNCTLKPWGSFSLEELLPGVLGASYIWGGRSGFGFDCSGLTQFLCRAMGNEIPRDAGEQSAAGETLSFINEAAPGDLAFFDNTEGLIQHVGMITSPGHIIHASGRVRIDRIDQQGIFNVDTKQYTHKLRVIKRLS